MPRAARRIVGGYVYHVLNRANGRLRLFKKDADFAAFERIIDEAHQRVPLRILSYVVMGNHWHFVVWPRRGGGHQVSDFFRWLAITHAQRWHAHHATAGTGHIYQGRFKSFPVATDEYLFTLLRYVDRNPLRGPRLAGRGLAVGQLAPPRVWDRRRSPLARRTDTAVAPRLDQPRQPTPDRGRTGPPQRSVQRGRPYGSESWQHKVARQLALEHTFRPRGRPSKPSTPATKGS